MKRGLKSYVGLHLDTALATAAKTGIAVNVCYDCDKWPPRRKSTRYKQITIRVDSNNLVTHIT